MAKKQIKEGDTVEFLWKTGTYKEEEFSGVVTFVGSNRKWVCVGDHNIPQRNAFKEKAYWEVNVSINQLTAATLRGRKL